jgi:hypothetical protein
MGEHGFFMEGTDKIAYNKTGELLLTYKLYSSFANPTSLT